MKCCIPNKYEIYNDICFLYITKLDKTVIVAIINTKDYKRVKLIHWNCSSKGYIRSAKNIYLHRFILNAPANLEVDHKNNKPLDNRRKNIRLCTVSQNRKSQLKNKNNISGYKGVSFYPRYHKCWRVVIYTNGKQSNLGYFNNKIEAAKAYNQAAKKYHGEFAKLNRTPLSKGVKDDIKKIHD